MTAIGAPQDLLVHGPAAVRAFLGRADAA
jgi:hypothetical protein